MGRLKDAMIIDQETAELEQAEPDYDYEYITLGEEEYERYQNIFDNGKYCEGCTYNQTTKDAYGTGDSPTMRECMVRNILDCPGMTDITPWE